MLSPEALALFDQLLSSVQLGATDPQLEAKAGLIVRVRTELAAAIAGTRSETAPEGDGP